MSDELNQIIDLEYTWGDFPAVTAEQIYKAYDARSVCAQVTTCNGAAILALEKRIAELERERDAAIADARFLPSPIPCNGAQLGQGERHY